MRRLALVVTFMLCGTLAVAQVPAAAPRPAARPTPRIDPLSAVIHGRVTTSTGGPIRRAEIRATSDGGISRMATSDGDGRFELRDLPAGTFRLSVSKSGFVSLQFGQRRALETAKTIALKEGERFAADMTLPRGGAIAGRVYDVFGEPLAGVRVNAMRSRMAQGRRRLQPIGAPDVSDDTGAFRLYGLTPGEYYLSARSGQGRPGSERGGAVVFYPGTADFTQAQRLTVDAVTEATALFQLVPLNTASVTGTVVDASGAPVEASVNLLSEALGLGYTNALAGGIPLMLSGHSAADGRFVIGGVPPGPYALQANTLLAPGPNGPSHHSGRAALVVDNQGVSGLSIVIGEGGTIAGTIIRDPAANQPIPSGIGVIAQGAGSSMQMRMGNTFRLTGIVGPVRFGVEGLPEGWAVRSITIDGRDVTDSLIDLKNGQTASARVVLTDRVTQVTGAVSPRPRMGDARVVVFSDDATKWTYPSRFVTTTRADENGRFRISGLPAGERYLATAVEYLEDGEETDAEFLERMRASATSFTLAEAGRATLDLRLVAR